MNKEDIDKKFNFKTNQNQCFAELIDEVGKPFVEKIISIRDQQKALLPLYMESKILVQKHQNCLRTVLKQSEPEKMSD